MPKFYTVATRRSVGKISIKPGTRVMGATVKYSNDDSLKLIERGRLLYQEEWSKKHRFKNRDDIFAGALLVFAGLSVLGLGIYSLIRSYPDISIAEGPVFIIFGVFMLLYGSGVLVKELKNMPFEVYEKGFTLPTVPFRAGLRRRDIFINWTRLKRASLGRFEMYNVGLRNIKLIYDEDKELDLDAYIITDPFEVIKALDKYVPEKMEENFRIYTGKEDERKVIKPFIPMKASEFTWLMPFSVLIFISILTGYIMPSILVSKNGIIALIMILSIMVPVAVAMFWIMTLVDKNNQQSRIHFEARATSSGIEFPRTVLGRIIRKTRSIIPYDEVKIVRMKLDPVFYSHEAEFETAAGERFRAPFGIYEKVSQIEGFELKDYDYINKFQKSSKGPIIAWNRRGLAVLVLLLGAMTMIGPLIAGNILQAFEEFRYLIFIIIFAVLLPVIIFTFWMMSQRSRVSTGISANDREIFLPNAPDKFRSIAKNEFVGARINKDIFGYYCELNSVKGRLKLTQAAAENLIDAGYPVENAENIGQFQPSDYLKYQKAVKIKKDHQRTPGQKPGVEQKKSGPGKLIWEEGRESISAKFRRTRSHLALLSLVGAATVAVPSIIGYLYSGLIWNFLVVFFVALGGGLLIIGLMAMAFLKEPKPVRVYENGIEFPEAMKKDRVAFVPYGRIKTYAELKMPVWGDAVQFRVEAYMRYAVPKSVPGFTKAFESIKGRIGNPDYDVADFQLVSEVMFGRMTALFYGIAVGLGYLCAILFLFFQGFHNLVSLTTKTLLYGSPLAIIIFAYIVYYLQYNKTNISYKGNIKPKPVICILVALMIMFAIGWAIDKPDLYDQTIYQDDPPATFALGSGTVENVNLTLNDNVYVAPGSTLVIRNSTIMFNTTYNKEYSIYADKDSRLEIINSSITARDYRKGYGFEIYGSARLADSDFSYLFGTSEHENGDGGIEIYSSDVLISNSSISHNQVNGILIAHSSPTIENCMIESNYDEGIELHDSSAAIRNNMFRENGWTIAVNARGMALIEENLFENNTHGMYVYGSEPTIKNNAFLNTDEYAVKIFSYAYPKFDNNSYQNNGEDVVWSTSLDSILSICSIILILAGALVIGFILVKAAQIESESRKDGQL
jgi:parallel beta-helix repeat protein